MSKPVRTRFAPSPTGFLHIGGVRTTFFSWLLAKHFGGTFILRIEDTDRERLVPESVGAILRDLNWLGLDINEGPSNQELLIGGYKNDLAKGIGGEYGPYIQSQRKERYKEIAEELVRLGVAYRCDCTAEKLEAERAKQAEDKIAPGYSGYCRHRNISADTKHVIRFIIPDNETIVMEDAIRGNVVWEKPALKDVVLLKSDGFPTYHLAVVVDDHDMAITHVIRGDEWIATAPIHILLYKALGWEAPIFAHVPPVLGKDGKKFSKRHGAKDVMSFRDMGILPDALLNFLLLIGWSAGSGDEQEIFTREEMIKRFSLSNVSVAGGVFDEQKLKWMNSIYIRNRSHDQLFTEVKNYLTLKNISIDDTDLRGMIPHIQERMEFLSGAESLLEFLHKGHLPDISYLKSKGHTTDTITKVISILLKKLETSSDNPQYLEIMNELVNELGIKKKFAFEIVRIAVLSNSVTPPLTESMEVLGKARVIKNLTETLKVI